MGNRMGAAMVMAATDSINVPRNSRNRLISSRISQGLVVSENSPLDTISATCWSPKAQANTFPEETSISTRPMLFMACAMMPYRSLNLMVL